MRDLEGESDRGLLRAFFDRRLKFEFHGSRITSDAGLLAYRELDEALGLTTLAGDVIADSRTGKNGWHGIIGLLRQSVYGRLAGYEDVNDADRLGRDPAMRWIVGDRAVERGGASTSQMGVNGGAKLVHPGGAKLVHLMLCGTRCLGVVPVVHRRDPRCFV